MLIEAEVVFTVLDCGVAESIFEEIRVKVIP